MARIWPKEIPEILDLRNSFELQYQLNQIDIEVQ